jgi:hypothetical protein
VRNIDAGVQLIWKSFERTDSELVCGQVGGIVLLVIWMSPGPEFFLRGEMQCAACSMV